MLPPLPILFLTVLVLLRSCQCSATVNVRGTSTSEVNYAFLNTLAQYELSHPGFVFDAPLGLSAANTAALLAGEVDFAMVSAPITTAQAAAHPNATVLPIAATAVVPVYRLDALDAAITLIFSGRTLALVYAGNITTWNDASIQADNPGVVLPSQNITVVFLNQSRHFNYILLTALNKFEPSIASLLPPSNQPAWPTSRYAAYIGVTSLTGTSAEVVDADGALSVDSQNFAAFFEATIGDMYNHRGDPVTANGLSLFYSMAELLTDTAASVTSFADMTDCLTSNCWPIACPDYVLIDTYAAPRGCEVRSAVVDFLFWYYQQTVIVERTLTHYGLQPLSAQLAVSTTLAAITCWGKLVPSVLETVVYGVAGVDRLQPVMNMVVDLHAIVDSSVDFDYNVMTSTAAMLTGRSTLQLAVLYEVEINTTTTPIDYERYVLLPSFLTSVIMTFNTQLSPTVTLNATELVIDIRTLAFIILGNISDWSDPRLVALNPVLATLLDGDPAPIRFIHGCSTYDPGTTIAPLLTYFHTFLIAAIGSDPVVMAYVASPAGAEVIAALSVCSQAANTLRDWLYVSSDDTITTLVSNRPGSVGYAMDGDSEEGVGAGVGVFAIVMAAEVDGRSVATVRRSTPAALAACAAAGQLDSTTLTLDVFGAQSNPDCWPLTQVVYMQVPRDYPADSYAMGVATVDLLQWVYTTDALDVWCEQNMFVRIASLPALQSALLSALDTITSGGMTVLTLPYVWQLTSAIFVVACCMQVLGCIMGITSIALIVRHRGNIILRSASPPFMVLSLVGLLLLFGAIPALVLPPTSSTCTAFSWLIQLGFTVTFAPLFAKAYRIYRIFGRRRLQVVKIGNRRLLATVAVGMLVDVVYLSIWHSVAPPTVITKVQLTTTASDAVLESDYAQCTWEGTSANFMGVECALKVVALCLGVMLAFGTRQVTDRFNDSKRLSLSIYNLVSALVVILPILVLIEAVGDARVLLLLFCIAEIGFGTLGILFLPKLYSVLAASHVHPTSAPHHSTHPQPSDAYSFPSVNQLSSLPDLHAYLAALVQHTEDVRRVQAGRDKKTSLASTGVSHKQTSAPRPSTSASGKGRKPRDEVANVGSEAKRTNGWVQSSHSRAVSAAATSSRARQSMTVADPTGHVEHSRGESGVQDSKMDGAVKDALAAPATGADSAPVALSVAAEAGAATPPMDVDDDVVVSTPDHASINAVEGATSGGFIEAALQSAHS